MTNQQKPGELERSQIVPALLASIVWFVIAYVVVFSGGASGGVALVVAVLAYGLGFLVTYGMLVSRAEQRRANRRVAGLDEEE